MIQGVPSKTAFRVATRRAAHQLLDSPLVFDDPLALRILGPAAEAALCANPAELDQSALSRHLRAFLCARSQYAEDSLAQHAALGVRQYVLLGAGLDTFAYRNPHENVRVFEVDHPSTQAWKRELLAAAGIAIPESVQYVAVDFETQQLGDELARAGFEAGSPAVFAWLGVVPYLTEASIMSTLHYIAAVTGSPSGLVFDYAVPPSDLSAGHRAAFEAVAARVRAAGEPWQTYFRTATLVSTLLDIGFRAVESIGPDEINARYFDGRADGLRVGSLGHFMKATK